MLSSAAGNVYGPGHQGEVGGLVGYNYAGGTIVLSRATNGVNLSRPYYSPGSGGGLIGSSQGAVSKSFATGNILGQPSDILGGLVGRQLNGSTIDNSYATGDVRSEDWGNNPVAFMGGFAGGGGPSVTASYATGELSGPAQSKIGGFSGSAFGNGCANCYWDIDTSQTDQGTGEGNEFGITGLTDAQLKSGLPGGFDPKIWAQNAKINNGYPYLIDNPPAQ